MRKSELVAILAPLLEPYPAEVQKLTLDAAWKLAQRFDEADALIYDNYNFVVCGYTFTGRPSDAFLSVVVAWDHVSVCFLQGVHLHDPEKRLKGGGNLVRNLRLQTLKTLDDPYVSNLIDAAAARVKKGGSSGKAILQSVSAKKRRPAGNVKTGSKSALTPKAAKRA